MIVKRYKISPAGRYDKVSLKHYTSLKTEESQSIACYIVYIDPDNPDPKPPARIVKDRWSYVKLSKRVPFTPSSLVKIAKASDPRS